MDIILYKLKAVKFFWFLVLMVYLVSHFQTHAVFIINERGESIKGETIINAKKHIPRM